MCCIGVSMQQGSSDKAMTCQRFTFVTDDYTLDNAGHRSGVHPHYTHACMYDRYRHEHT